MKTKIIIIALLLSVGARAATDSVKSACPVVKIEVERLPDLNIPRAGHYTFYAGGELTVTGGHTNGFVPTPTVEYYKDGEWHTLQMTYPHDNGFSIVLKSGKVMIGGGHSEPIGVGQTFLTEFYDPQSHGFEAFCSLSRKRALASALELDSGRIVLAGNWYADDGIEMFEDKPGTRADINRKRLFNYIKDVSVGRVKPFILQTAENDAVIVGSMTTRGDTLWTTVADRLRGDPVEVPLFEHWHPMYLDRYNISDCFIGDEAKGVYSYLIMVQNREGEVAIAKAENGDFSLLPTICPVPMYHAGEKIEYSTIIIADRKAERGYLVGISESKFVTPEKSARWYVLSVDYTKSPAPLTLYYTDPIPDFNAHIPVLTPEGDLVIAGGMYRSNFTPSKQVLLLRLGREPVGERAGIGLWLVALLVLAVLLLVSACAYLIYYKKRRQVAIVESETPDEAKQLMNRINKVMEEQKLYQRSDLKLQDLAAVLGTNRRTISDCVNSQTRCSFAQYVNNYRIEHAKRLLHRNAGQKIAEVYHESGFANETTFFRTFKAVTGLTPKEWLNKS